MQTYFFGLRFCPAFFLLFLLFIFPGESIARDNEFFRERREGINNRLSRVQAWSNAGYINASRANAVTEKLNAEKAALRALKKAKPKQRAVRLAIYKQAQKRSRIAILRASVAAKKGMAQKQFENGKITDEELRSLNARLDRIKERIQAYADGNLNDPRLRQQIRNSLQRYREEYATYVHNYDFNSDITNIDNIVAGQERHQARYEDTLDEVFDNKNVDKEEKSTLRDLRRQINAKVSECGDAAPSSQEYNSCQEDLVRLRQRFNQASNQAMRN